MTHSLSIDFVQANATVGDLQGNAELALDYIRHSDAELVVFPECFLTGYPLQDLVLRPHFMRQVHKTLDWLAEQVQALNGASVLMGTPLEGSGGIHNAAVLLNTDGSRQVTTKCELPNNDVFDERRIFAQGSNPKPLTFGKHKLGVMICEDMWHGPVSRYLADEGADILIVLNGSPMEINKEPLRENLALRRSQETKLPLVYLNLVGGQDELVFDGSSFVLDKEEISRSRYFGPSILSTIWETVSENESTLNLVSYREESRQGAMYKFNDEDARVEQNGLIYQTVVLGLRDYLKKNGFSSVTLGLSGGLDSALVAAIAADAIGPKNVYTFMLPSQYTGGESLGLAKQMADDNEFPYRVVSIGDLTGLFGVKFEEMLQGEEVPSIAMENIQARIRGNILMAFSNSIPGTIVLSTGNKSEVSVGYSTLYGDMCGGFNPIKDLYKTRVQEISHWRNTLGEKAGRHGLLGIEEPIPERIITRPPTAELKEEQTDEAALGAYEVLDAVLDSLIEHSDTPEVTVRILNRKWGYDRIDLAYVTRIARLVKMAEYKRRQAAPGIKLTSRSFGFGWRYPITNLFQF